MADRPILFSAPMIQTLLAGTKTQTRRVIKPQPGADGLFASVKDAKRACRIEIGDRLWVRETLAVVANWGVFYNASHPDETGFINERDERAWAILERWGDSYNASDRKRVPSIFMPRWASRLTLIVTDVRVQRLQEISAEDAQDEGVDRRSQMVRQMWLFGADKAQREAIYLRACPWEFEKLWDEINGPGAWEANPWVAAYTFTVHRENIDRVPASEILECRA